MQYAVWYASIGCLPDNMEDGPEFVGTLEECERYVEVQETDDAALAAEGFGADHNLYRYTVEPYDAEEGE